MPLCDYRIHSGYIKGKLFACYIRETAVIGQCRNRVNCSCTEVNYTVGKGCALNVGIVAERKGYGVPALFKFEITFANLAPLYAPLPAFPPVPNSNETNAAREA